MKKKFDKKKIYCRKLGHFVPFLYCRTEHMEFPCMKIFDCWFKKIPIETFINKFYSKEEIQNIFKPAQPKISSLIDLIEKAKKVS